MLHNSNTPSNPHRIKAKTSELFRLGMPSRLLTIVCLAFFACAQKITVPVFYELKNEPVEFGGKIEPDSVNVELLEYAIFLQTNLQRQRLGLWPLRFEPRARSAARHHSEEMVRLHYFSHTSPDSKNRTLKKRLLQVGLREGTAGENIAIYPIFKRQEVLVEKPLPQLEVPRDFWRNQGIRFTYDEFAKTLVERWMNSPGHRSNILNRHFRFLGVGCAIGMFNGADVFYVTQDFASTNY